MIRHGATLMIAGALALAIGVPSVELPDAWEGARPVSSQDSDHELQAQLQDALDEGWGLSNTQIVVESVQRGRVTLSGKAETISDHRHTVKLVANFPGVREVRSYCQVSGAVSAIDTWSRPGGSNARGALSGAWIEIELPEQAAPQRR